MEKNGPSSHGSLPADGWTHISFPSHNVQQTASMHGKNARPLVFVYASLMSVAHAHGYFGRLVNSCCSRLRTPFQSGPSAVCGSQHAGWQILRRIHPPTGANYPLTEPAEGAAVKHREENAECALVPGTDGSEVETKRRTVSCKWRRPWKPFRFTKSWSDNTLSFF